MGKYDGLLDTRTEQNVVELARVFGPDIVNWLKKVVDNKFNELGFAESIPLAQRLVAADLLRKFAAIPTNVDFNIKTAPIIEYIGDRELKEVTVGATKSPVALLPGTNAEPETVGRPRSRRKRDVRGHGRSGEVREERLAD